MPVANIPDTMQAENPAKIVFVFSPNNIVVDLTPIFLSSWISWKESHKFEVQGEILDKLSLNSILKDTSRIANTAVSKNKCQYQYLKFYAYCLPRIFKGHEFVVSFLIHKKV